MSPIATYIEDKIKKLEMELLTDDEDDFIFCLKIPLMDRILFKVLTRKKSMKFTKFHGL